MQNSHTDKYARSLDPLIGNGRKEHIESRYGAPEVKHYREKGESWTYLFLVPDEEYTALDKDNDGKYPVLYDCLVVYFDQNGVLQQWTLTVGPKKISP